MCDPLTPPSWAGYTLLYDVYGNPALIFEGGDAAANLPSGSGQSAVYFVASLELGLVFRIAVMLLLEKSVVSRLSGLNASVASIASSGRRFGPLALHGERRDFPFRKRD